MSSYFGYFMVLLTSRWIDIPDGVRSFSRNIDTFCVIVQNDNHKLANELQSAISQNTEITEKFVRSELTREQLRAQLHDLKQTTGCVNDIHHTVLCRTQRFNHSICLGVMNIHLAVKHQVLFESYFFIENVVILMLLFNMDSKLSSAGFKSVIIHSSLINSSST